MALIDDVSGAVLMLIRAGVVFRVMFCFFKIMVSEEEAAHFRKRLKHAIVFYLIAECVFLLKSLILAYYA